MLGYAKWQRFSDNIERAQESMNLEHPETLKAAFVQVTQLTGTGNLEQERADFELSREACYRIAMTGDTRKPEVKAAHKYFYVRTRQAELASTTTPAIPATYAEALRLAADEHDRASKG